MGYGDSVVCHSDLATFFIVETGISLMEVDCCFLAVMLLVVLDSPVV